MGTAGYMAPEQVRGQQVDGRADLFALGVVLYEMVAGQQAFARESTVETLNAILKEDPPELTTKRAGSAAGPRSDRAALSGEEPSGAISIGARRDLRPRDADREQRISGRLRRPSSLPHEACYGRACWRGRLLRSPRPHSSLRSCCCGVPRRLPGRRGSSRSARHTSVFSHMRPLRSLLMARRWRSGRRMPPAASNCGFEIWAARRRARCPIR